jgi:nitroreductase
MPSDEVIQTIVRAGQQAPFAYQLCSVLLSRAPKKIAWGAPLDFTICVDVYRFERIMELRGWRIATNDLSLLLLGIQDAALMAENMVIAAESLGLGSCFIGEVAYQGEEIAAEFNLPERVFPLVGLVMGYPAENPPPRPRYPLAYTLIEGEYPRFDEASVRRAMQEMDEGYLRQNYYSRRKALIPLPDSRPETYTLETYSWTEHISRKLGLWKKSPRKLLRVFKSRGFKISGTREASSEATRDKPK